MQESNLQGAIARLDYSQVSLPMLKRYNQVGSVGVEPIAVRHTVMARRLQLRVWITTQSGDSLKWNSHYELTKTAFQRLPSHPRSITHA